MLNYIIIKCMKDIVKIIKKFNKNRTDKDIIYARLDALDAYSKQVGYRKFIKEYIRSYFRSIWYHKFDTELAITAILKNEAPYIKEWIEFHKLVGVQKFYLYDNESTDNVKEILQPYIDSKEVIYKYFPGKHAQMAAYQDSIYKNATKVKYMAFIDIDEFITPIKHNTIPEFIEYFEKKINHKIDAVGINWVIHGFNGHKTKPEGLVCENFYKCSYTAERNNHIKSIVNPRSVLAADHPHFCLHRIGSKVVNCNGDNIYGPFAGPYIDEIYISHYWTKSNEEYIIRCQKGKAGYSTPIPLKYEPDYLSTDNNYPVDRFIPQLKEKLSR